MRSKINPVSGRLAVAMEEELGLQFRQHSRWLLRRLRLGREATGDAEDLVQESFIRLARYAPHLRSEPRGLLLKIASNLQKDGRRRAAARAATVPMTSPSADQALSRCEQPDQEALLSLKLAILALPAVQRDTFLLSRYTPMTNAQIAARLGVSVKTVEWRLQQALAALLVHFE